MRASTPRPPVRRGATGILASGTILLACTLPIALVSAAGSLLERTRLMGVEIEIESITALSAREPVASRAPVALSTLLPEPGPSDPTEPTYQNDAGEDLAAIDPTEAGAVNPTEASDGAAQGLIAAFRVLEEQLRRAGIDAGMFTQRAASGLGGPYEPISSRDEATLPGPSPSQSAVLQSVLASMPLAAPLDEVDIRSGYGIRQDPFTGRKAWHRGLDIDARQGDRVLAAAGGKVLKAGRDGAFGNVVDIESGLGIVTRYAHLAKALVREGTEVDTGQPIGIAGATGRATGIHLHYEVRIDGQSVDPSPFLKAGRSIGALDPG